jgi:hypothetical protein
MVQANNGILSTVRGTGANVSMIKDTFEEGKKSRARTHTHAHTQFSRNNFKQRKIALCTQKRRHSN